MVEANRTFGKKGKGGNSWGKSVLHVLTKYLKRKREGVFYCSEVRYIHNCFGLLTCQFDL